RPQPTPEFQSTAFGVASTGALASVKQRLPPCYLGVPKHGPIATLWQIDHYLASRPLGGIVLCQAGPKFSRLCSHDGILSDVVVRPASEHLDSDDGFFELIPDCAY